SNFLWWWHGSASSRLMLSLSSEVVSGTDCVAHQGAEEGHGPPDWVGRGVYRDSLAVPAVTVPSMVTVLAAADPATPWWITLLATVGPVLGVVIGVFLDPVRNLFNRKMQLRRDQREEASRVLAAAT